MEALFKKYFWVVNLTVLTAVAWLTAKTVVDYLAAQYLTIETSEVAMTAVADDVTLLQKANGEELAGALADRTPFNLDPKEKPASKSSSDPDCKPECDGKACGDDGCGGTCGECTDDEICNEGKCEANADGPEESELNVELIGTIASPTNPGARFANIKADGSIEMVTVGSDILDGKATVIDIQSRIMYLKEGSKLTHVTLWSESATKKSSKSKGKKSGRVTSSRPNLKRPDPSKSAKVTKSSPSSRPAKFDYSSGVKKDGEFDYTIDKQMLDEQLTDLTQLGMQARVIPNYRKGKYEGFKLVGVRPGSLYRAIGIRSGDIVRSINGEAINSPNKAMELFNKLKNSSSLNLEVERRGKIEQFNYSIR
jgi:general secretion pathway protein C